MSKSIALLLVLVLTASCLIAFKPVSAASPNSWTSKAPMHVARFGLGVAAVNGKIYAIGGLMMSETNEEYDPKTDTWSYKAPMPTPRAEFGIAVYQNKIYCIGGAGGVNEVYDPVANTWETKTSMPTPRGALSANLVNGKIYLIGGSPNVNEVYDPASDTWTLKTAPSGDASWAVSAVVDDKIYVIGGELGSNLNQIYTPETDTWSMGAPLPHVYPGGAAATTGVLAPKRIYVFGGGGLVQNNKNQIYDPENDSWSAGATMLTARAALGVAVVDDLLYVIGGGNGWASFFSRANEQYTPFGYGTVPPAVTVLSSANATYSGSSVLLNFTVDRQVSWLGYSLDGKDNVTITGNTTLTNLPSGVHNVTVYAKGEDGNIGSSKTITFTVAPEPFPTLPVAALSAVLVVAVGTGLIVYFKKRKH